MENVWVDARVMTFVDREQYTHTKERKGERNTNTSNVESMRKQM